MAIGIGHGKTPVNTVIGNQVFSATMVGDVGATPKLVLAFLVRGTTNDVVEADGYLTWGASDGVQVFCEDVAVEDAVATSIGRRGLLANTATSVDIIRTRTAANTADTSNVQCALRFVSFSASSVTLNVRIAPPAGYFLVFVLIGGSDFTALVDNFTTTVNVGTPLDRTGLGVPAEAAILCATRLSIGATTGGIGPTIGFWSASAHSLLAALSSDFRTGQNPPAVEQEVRSDVNAVGITGATEHGCTLSQIATGYRVTAQLGQPFVNQKCIIAMSFSKKLVAWTGFLDTPTALGGYSWKSPHLRPKLALAALTRRPNVNTGDGAGSADSSVAGFGVWTSALESALAISQENGTSPTVSKMHQAGRFLSIPRTDGQLIGDPTTPNPEDAILGSATEGAEGLEFTFTRTSSVARKIPMLVLGDEQTLVPTPALVGLLEPSVNLLQLQLPSPVLIPLVEPPPFLGFIRPTPVAIGVLALPVALDLPEPATPGFEDGPPPPFAEFYGTLLLDLLPRGLAWTRDPSTVIGRLLRAFAEELARIEVRGLDLIRESDVRQTHELLAEWEAWLRTREDCPDLGATDTERRFALLIRLATAGGQNAFHYAEIAQLLGYDIDVVDFVGFEEFRVGISAVGDALSNGAWVFTILIHAPTVSPIFFRAGLSSAGDPLTTGGNSNARLQCELDRIRPAHMLFLYAFDKPYTGYSPWNVIGPSPVTVGLGLPHPTIF